MLVYFKELHPWSSSTRDLPGLYSRIYAPLLAFFLID